MSGADFCKFNRCLSTRLTPLRSWEHTLQTSPSKNNNLHSVTAASTVWDSGSIGLLLVWQSRPSQVSLFMRFLFVNPELCPQRHFSAPTSGFLRIPPHDGHPCLRLMLPATERIVDFHHQVIAHVGRTKMTAYHKSGKRSRVHIQNFVIGASCVSKVHQPQSPQG